MDSQLSLLHDSIADIPEAELADRLLADSHWRSTLFGIRGIAPDAIPLFRVSLNVLSDGARGDVDIMLLPSGRPGEATAIEVKRIKVGLDAVRTDSPNKMHEFKKGIRQANLLASLGFSQVYLWAVVVVDTRQQNAGRYTYDGPRCELRSKISQLISVKGLQPRVGLARYQFVQPMDHPPLELGTYGCHLVRLAQAIRQPDELTARIERFRALA